MVCFTPVFYHLWERGPSRLAFCDEETPFLMFGLPLLVSSFSTKILKIQLFCDQIQSLGEVASGNAISAVPHSVNSLVVGFSRFPAGRNF
jgi:hypothetical protein